MLNWFDATVYAAVLYIIGLTVAETVSGAPFDELRLACAVFLLLILPVLYKLVSRRPAKERPVHISFAPKKKR